MTSTKNNLDQTLDTYEKAASSNSKKTTAAKMVGFGAAAAGGLLACSQAEADIISSGPLNFQFTDVAYAFDIDSDGNADIALGVQGVPPSDGTGGWAFFGQGTKGGFAFQGTGGAVYPGVLQQSASAGTVSAGNVATAGTGWMGWAAGGVATTDVWGAIANPNSSRTGFIGFQFNGSTKNGSTAGTMNAWMHVGITFDDNNTNGVVDAGDTFTTNLISFSYQNDPTDTFNGYVGGTRFDGTPGGIHLGAVVPEPSAVGLLGLLALGAAGMRRRKKQAA